MVSGAKGVLAIALLHNTPGRSSYTSCVLSTLADQGALVWTLLLVQSTDLDKQV